MMKRAAMLFALIFTSMSTTTSASGAEVAWQGTLTLDFTILESLGPVQAEGMGVASIEELGFGIHSLRLNGGITETYTTDVLNPVDPNITVGVGASVVLGTGTLGPFWPPQPLTANTLPVGGNAKLCIFVPGCGLYIPFPFSQNAGQEAVGVGGLVAAGGVRFSIDAAPWTVGTASVSFPTPGGDIVEATTRGWVHGPISFSGSTALAGGVLSVVTPVQVRTGSDFESINSFARLEVRFIPEPARFALLIAGVVGLGLLGRIRIRR